MADQPRLIILDARHNTRPYALTGRRMADLLRAPKPPLFVMPGLGVADRPDQIADNGKLLTRDNTVRNPDYAALATKVQATLAAGRDVVLLGPQRQPGQPVSPPPQGWAEDVAKAAGARLIGYRMTVDNREPPEDDNPNSDWPLAAWKTTDDGASFSIRVATEIDAEAPRPGADARDARLVTVMLGDKDPGRDALGQALHQQNKAHIQDLDVLYNQLKREEQADPVGTGMVSDARIARHFFPMMEKEILQGLRLGRQQVVLASKSLLKRMPELQAMLEVMGHVTETPARHLSIQQGEPTADPSREALFWPEEATQRDSAIALANEITDGGGDEPSLDDLLDAPLAERTRPVSPKL